MKDKYLIVSDLDGTLIDENGVYKGISRNYFKNLKKEGHIIAIATGRVLNTITGALGNIDFIDYIIVNNGAAIYEVVSKKFIYRREIDIKILEKILPEFVSELKKVEVRSPIEAMSLSLEHPYSDLKEFGIVTALVMYLKEENKINEVIKKLQFSNSSIHFFLMQDSFSDNKRINANTIGVSKYNAIQWLQKEKNILAENVIAFGDGLNDLDMIKNCAISVAVANALDEVKKEAKFISLYAQEEGVVSFLKDYFSD